MADLKLTDEAGQEFEKRFDQKLWPSLDKVGEKVLSGEYKGQDTTVFQLFRRGRSADDIKKSSLSLLTTVQNRLSSRCNSIASKLEARLGNEKDHKSTELIKTMGRCLNIETIIEKGTADETFNNTGEENLKILLDTAKYSKE